MHASWLPSTDLGKVVWKAVDHVTGLPSPQHKCHPREGQGAIQLDTNVAIIIV